MVGKMSCLRTFTRLHCGSKLLQWLIVLGPLLWQPQANSLCGDWHTFFVPALSTVLHSALSTASWLPLAILVFPCLPSLQPHCFPKPRDPHTRNCSLQVLCDGSVEKFLPTLREMHFVLTSGLVSQPTNIYEAPTERIAVCPAPSGDCKLRQMSAMANTPHFSLGVATSASVASWA